MSQSYNKNILLWPQVRLGDVAHVIMGQSPASSAYNSSKRGLPLIQGNNDIKKRKTVSRVWTSEITKIVEAGDIVLTVRAPVGLVGIAIEKVCIGRGVCGIQTKNASKDFIFKFLEYFEPKWGSLEQGSTFTAVNSSDIRKLRLFLPPLVEQNRIVSVLETWDKVIEKLTQKIELKKQVKKGLMQNLLSGKMRLDGFTQDWILVSLVDVGKCLRGVNYKPEEDLLDKDTPKSFRLLRSTNVQKGKVVIHDIQIVVGERVKKEQVLRIGDILICMANGSKNLVGKSSKFSLVDSYQYTFGSFMGVFRVSKIEDNDFINFLFETNRYRYYISNLLSGSSINNLKSSDIEGMRFKIPSDKKERDAIVNILITSDKEIELLEKKLQQIKQQKKYLLNNLITGAIRTPENLQ